MPEALGLPSSSEGNHKSNTVTRLALKMADRVNTILITTSKLSLTGATLIAPPLFALHPEARNLFADDIFSKLIGATVGTISLATGGVLAKRQLTALDQKLADVFGHEPVFLRAARALAQKDLEPLKEYDDAPIATALFDDAKFREFLPDGFRWYYSGEHLPVDMEESFEIIGESLGYYPKEMLIKHIDSITLYEGKNTETEGEESNLERELFLLPEDIRETLVAGLKERRTKQETSMVLGRAKRRKKNISLSTRALERDIGEIAMHHEMAHMVFLHMVTAYFEDAWRKDFGERQSDQTEYAEHPLFGSDINYGVIHAVEDMATIAEYMFTRDGWGKLGQRVRENQRYGVRPGIFMRKILRMKDFFYRQSKGKMDDGYFQRIEDGTIVTWQDAQAYFHS